MSERRLSLVVAGLGALAGTLPLMERAEAPVPAPSAQEEALAPEPATVRRVIHKNLREQLDTMPKQDSEPLDSFPEISAAVEKVLNCNETDNDLDEWEKWADSLSDEQLTKAWDIRSVACENQESANLVDLDGRMDDANRIAAELARRYEAQGYTVRIMELFDDPVLLRNGFQVDYKNPPLLTSDLAMIAMHGLTYWQDREERIAKDAGSPHVKVNINIPRLDEEGFTEGYYGSVFGFYVEEGEKKFVAASEEELVTAIGHFLDGHLR